MRLLRRLRNWLRRRRGEIRVEERYSYDIAFPIGGEPLTFEGVTKLIQDAQDRDAEMLRLHLQGVNIAESGFPVMPRNAHA